MNSLISKIKKIHTALNSIQFDHIYHYDASTSSSNRYIVWQEEAQADSNYLNNNLEEQTVQGSIDFYTKTEFDDLADEIQKTLVAHSIAFSLFAIQYEKETGYIHYTWNWEVS